MSDVYQRIDRFIEWFKCHRTEFGGVCAALGAVLFLATTYWDYNMLKFLSGAAVLLGTHLGVAGITKSDDFHKDKLHVLKTGLDRRNTDSQIPVKDLRKMLAEEQKEDMTSRWDKPPYKPRKNRNA